METEAIAQELVTAMNDVCRECGHGPHVLQCDHVFGVEGTETHKCGCEETTKVELPPEALAAVLTGALAIATLQR